MIHLSQHNKRKNGKGKAQILEHPGWRIVYNVQTLETWSEPSEHNKAQDVIGGGHCSWQLMQSEYVVPNNILNTWVINKTPDKPELHQYNCNVTTAGGFGWDRGEAIPHTSL